MNILSLFSGCGGLDLGFIRAGYHIPIANEYDKTIWNTYQQNFPHTFLLKKDINNLNITDIFSHISNIDGIIGGPPCQSWSIAGSHKGINDTRGKLFYNYIQLLDQIKPKFFVVENVLGLLTAKNLPAFQHIKQLFKQTGYDITTHIVNAKNYNVPQERKRIFIIGFRKDLHILYSFPKPTTHYIPTLYNAIKDLQKTAIPAMEKNYHNRQANNNNEYYVGSFSSRFMSRNRVKSWNEPAYTIQASGRQAQLHLQAPKMNKYRNDDYRFVEDKIKLYRRLTVRESARIQTFPDNFKFIYGNVNDGYKMIGNAVPVNLAQTVAESILRQMGSLNHSTDLKYYHIS